MEETVSAKEKVSHARDRVTQAEGELEEAKFELEREFRKALVALFNEYGFSVESNGCEGCRLEVNEITHEFTLEMLDY
jgi:hypothetical protein